MFKTIELTVDYVEHTIASYAAAGRHNEADAIRLLVKDDYISEERISQKSAEIRARLSSIKQSA